MTNPNERRGATYRARTEPWTPEAVYHELYTRIKEGTAVEDARAHELAESVKHKFGVSRAGALVPPPDDKLAADPFARTVTRIANLIDHDGKLPQPKTLDEVRAAARKAIGY